VSRVASPGYCEVEVEKGRHPTSGSSGLGYGKKAVRRKAKATALPPPAAQPHRWAHWVMRTRDTHQRLAVSTRPQRDAHGQHFRG
jgi:hypothetical protein